MKILQDVRDYVEANSLTSAEAIEAVMAAKSAEFNEAGFAVAGGYCESAVAETK